MESTTNSINNTKPGFCPYKKGNFSFFNRDEEEINTTTSNKTKTNDNISNSNIINTVDKEMGLASNTPSMCPYSSSSKIPSDSTKKCPYSGSSTNPPTKEDVPTADSDEDEFPSGGCPVMSNKTKKDPKNKHFEAYYEIPRCGQFDFMFLMRGLLNEEEYLEKTKKLRNYPRHLRYSLFNQGDEKLQKVHEKEFPVVFFMYDDIKEKGNRLYLRKKYREAIEHYVYSYGLLKWIQFKDKKRQEDFIRKPTLEPILDDDIIEKSVYLDDVKVEEDSYQACVVYLLMNLSYAYMELRHYSDALDCLNECAEVAEDKLPDVYLRRSQARTYNKRSTDEELDKAMKDIDKAIGLKPEEEIYKEHKEILKNIMEKRKKLFRQKGDILMEKVKKSYKRIKDNRLSFDQVIYTKSKKDTLLQYAVLKE